MGEHSYEFIRPQLPRMIHKLDTVSGELDDSNYSRTSAIRRLQGRCCYSSLCRLNPLCARLTFLLANEMRPISFAYFSLPLARSSQQFSSSQQLLLPVYRIDSIRVTLSSQRPCLCVASCFDCRHCLMKILSIIIDDELADKFVRFLWMLGRIRQTSFLWNIFFDRPPISSNCFLSLKSANQSQMET